MPGGGDETSRLGSSAVCRGSLLLVRLVGHGYLDPGPRTLAKRAGGPFGSWWADSKDPNGFGDLRGNFGEQEYKFQKESGIQKFTESVSSWKLPSI